MNEIICGNSLSVLRGLADESVDCVITSPPYWGLRDYGVDGQLGLEPHFNEYISKLIAIFDEVKRVLKSEGTCWVNLGDTYSGNKEGKTDAKVSGYLKETTTRLHKKAVIREKCLCQIPSRFAIAMTDRGWILRNRIIWNKPNAMPDSVNDRFTVDFEDIFFFVKSKKYYFEQQLEKSIWGDKDARAINGPSSGGKAKSGNYAINKGGAFRKQDKINKPTYTGFNNRYQPVVMRNCRTVWVVSTKPYSGAHFATYPETLVEKMILPGCPKGGIILDPFFGAGTTGVVAKKLGRNYLGIELNKSYCEIARKRIEGVTVPMIM